MAHVVIFCGTDDPETGSRTGLATSEYYNVNTGLFETGVSLPGSGIFKHSSIRTQDGRIFMVGGDQTNGPDVSDASAFLWDPRLNFVTQTTDVPVTLSAASSCALVGDTGIAVLGGEGQDRTVYVFDIVTEKWTTYTDLLGVERDYAAVVKLPDGNLLVVGGGTGGGATSAELITVSGTSLTLDAASPISLPGGQSMEAGVSASIMTDGRVLCVNDVHTAIYDPASKTFSAGAAGPELDGSLLILDTASSLVYRFGGLDPTPTPAMKDEVWTYNPLTDVWTNVGSMITARGRPSGTPLEPVFISPTQIFIAGGDVDEDGTATVATEIWSTVTDIATAGPDMAVARRQMFPVLIESPIYTPQGGGKTIVAGGTTSVDGDGLSTSEILLVGGSWDVGPALPTPVRSMATAKLDTGDLLIAGGYAQAADTPPEVATISQVTPSTETLAAALPFNVAREGASIVNTGDMLFAFGGDRDGVGLDTVEVYDPTTGVWTILASTMSALRGAGCRAALMTNGQILVAGGNTGASADTAELFDPDIQAFLTGTVGTFTMLAGTRVDPEVIALRDGRCLVVGGVGRQNSETFDPSQGANGAFTTLVSTVTDKEDFALVERGDGRVFAVGGKDGGTPNDKVEVYDFGDDTWAAYVTMASARQHPAVARTGPMSLLITGGYDGSALATTELLDLSLGFLSAGPTMAAARLQHVAEQLITSQEPDIELPLVGLDDFTEPAGELILANRSPEPGEIDVAKDSLLTVEIMSADVGSVDQANTFVYVDGDLAFDGSSVGTEFQAGYTGGNSQVVAIDGGLTLCIVLHRTTDWPSDKLIKVRVVSEVVGGAHVIPDSPAPGDETGVYYFLVEDHRLPEIASVSQVTRRVLDVTFTEQMRASSITGAGDALNHSLYVFQGLAEPATPLQVAEVAAESVVRSSTGEPAQVTAVAVGPYDMSGVPLTLDVEVNGGQAQTVTFVSSDFVDPSQATGEELAARITADLFRAEGVGTSTTILIQTLKNSSYATIEVTGGTANAVLDFPTEADAEPGAPTSEWLKTGQGESYQVTVAPDFSFRRNYRVSVPDIFDANGNQMDSANNSIDFLSEIPGYVPINRQFEIFKQFPEEFRKFDASKDLKRVSLVIQDVIDIVLSEIDRFPQIMDPDVAPPEVLDFLLCHLGNPFPFSMTVQKKRELIRSLVSLYKLKGTEPGLKNAVLFFTGVTLDVKSIFEGVLLLGVSELDNDWVLAPSGSAARYTFNIEVPSALTETQETQIRFLVELFKPAHTHLNKILVSP